MTRSPKDKAMLIAMGVLVLFAAYNFLIRPQGAKLDAVRDERTALEQSVSDAQPDATEQLQISGRVFTTALSVPTP